MHCYVISRVGLTTAPSVRSSWNSVLKTRYVHISGKAERDKTAGALPLDGRQLKRYIASMREVVDFYKGLAINSSCFD